MADFEWPTHNILNHKGSQRTMYNLQVREYVNNNIYAIPEVHKEYNDKANQVRIFEESQELSLRTKKGIVFSVYRVAIPYYTYEETVTRLLKDLRPLIQNASRVNACIGFIHTTHVPNKYGYKFASQNTMLAPESLAITRDSDLTDLEKYMEPLRVFDRIDKNFFTSYRMQVVAITDIQFHVWYSEHYKIGCRTALMKKYETFLQKRCVWTLPRKDKADDNKCFFRALAAHFKQDARSGIDRLTDKLWKLARARGLCLPPPNDTFIDITRTPELEELFMTNIRWYSLDDDLPPLQYTNATHHTTAHILRVDSHCALITDVHQFFEQHFCEQCKRVYASRQSLDKHKQNCMVQHQLDYKRWTFAGGPERPRIDPFDSMSAYNISFDQPLKFTQAFVAFDIECMLHAPPTNNFFSKSQQKYIMAEHVPVSIAVAYSGDSASVENPECFVSSGDTYALVEEFVRYLLSVHDRHENEQRVRYGPMLDALDARIESLERLLPPGSEAVAKFLPPKYKNCRIRRAYNELHGIRRHVLKCAFQLAVLGFNSSSYDLNAMRAWLIPALSRHDTKLSAVKRGNRYLNLSTTKFRFVDMYLFLSVTTSLKSFIKGYMTRADAENSKFGDKTVFPYQAMTNLEMLNATELPEVKYWVSCSLDKLERETDERVREQLMTEAGERRALGQQEWDRRGHKCMRDYLIDYNKADVSPFIKAVRNYAQFYIDRGFDIFQFLTLPSLAKQTALAACPNGAYFERFPKSDADLYHQVRAALYGGAAIVWTRLAEAGRTRIRPYEFGENTAELVERVIGLDMTACYLWATCQELPTGPYFIRHARNGFAIDKNIRNIQSIMAIEYCTIANYGYDALERLTHRYRGGETKITTTDYHIYSVDGYLKFDDGTVVIIEYNGCYFHNHDHAVCTMRHNVPANFDAGAEEERLAALRAYATRVHIIWECEWHAQLEQPCVHDFIAARPMYQTWVTRKGIADQEIIPRVMQDRLKGIFELDAYVPSARRHMFTDLAPFYYQTDINFEMIGPTMQNMFTVAERKFNTPRRMLVNAPFCKNLLLPHQYVKWLVRHGIIIHNIHKIIEYPLCSSPFYELGELICEERQKAARNEATEAEKAAGDTWKLIGNSIYGQFCMKPERFTDTVYVNAKVLARKLFTRKLCHINPLSDNLFELTVAKDIVRVSQCPQMGFFVYALSKLRMLSFGFEWLMMMERSRACLILTDTDSYYFALARQTWEECVRADVSETALADFKREYFALTPAQSKYRGLFHIEFSGTLLIALQPKLYFAVGENVTKISARGVDKRENTLDIDLFRHTLTTMPQAPEKQAVTNASNGEGGPQSKRQKKLIRQSFRVIDTSMVTYRMYIANINGFYIKRQVLDNLIDTAELDWHWPSDFTL